MDGGELDQGRAAGPRQQPAVKRRPLPSVNGPNVSRSDGDLDVTPVPIPQAGPRSYHTPPRAPANNAYGEDTYYPSTYDQSGQPQIYSAPPNPTTVPASVPVAQDLHSLNPPLASYQDRQVNGHYQERSNGHYGHQQPFVEEAVPYEDDRSPVLYSDDPYALQAVDAGEEFQEGAHEPVPIEHASTGRLDRNMSQNYFNYSPHRPQTDTRAHGQFLPNPIPNERDNPILNAINDKSPAQHTSYFSHRPTPPGPTQTASESVIGLRQAPPPPPTHRNSVPAYAYPLNDSKEGVRPERHSQALSGSSSEHSPWPRPLYNPGSLPRQAHSNPLHDQPLEVVDTECAPARRHSDNTAMSTYSSHDLPVRNPRVVDQAGYNHPNRYSPVAYNEPTHSYRPSQPSALSYIEQKPLTPNEDSGLHQPSLQHQTPVYRPRPISPTAPGQRPSYAAQITRKSVSPQPTAQGVKTNEPPPMPFSPDSFDAYNPHTHGPSKKNTTAFASREPQPMYSTKQQRPSPQAEQSASAPRRDSEPIINPDGTITRPDGRTVDPSDHLPTNTYAPEPERKGANRPSVNVNIKTRFGPREARPRATHPQPSNPANQFAPYPSPQERNITIQSPSSLPSTPPSTGRNILQKRSPATSSPLAPSPPAALNSAHSQAPPPVPGKIPLDQYREGNGDPGSQPYPSSNGGPATGYGSASALSQEMARIDLGPSPTAQLTAATETRYAGSAGGGRVRRSRFGA